MMIGKFLCWLKGKHKWRVRGFIANGKKHTFTDKECRRCGLVRAIKHRKVKV